MALADKAEQFLFDGKKKGASMECTCTTLVKRFELQVYY
jgi:hypothetical protein